MAYTIKYISPDGDEYEFDDMDVISYDLVSYDPERLQYVNTITATFQSTKREYTRIQKAWIKIMNWINKKLGLDVLIFPEV